MLTIKRHLEKDPVVPAGTFRYKTPVTVAKKAPGRAQTPAAPRKKFDWFLAFLYVLLVAGIALIGVITYFILLM